MEGLGDSCVAVVGVGVFATAGAGAVGAVVVDTGAVDVGVFGWLRVQVLCLRMLQRLLRLLLLLSLSHNRVSKRSGTRTGSRRVEKF